MIRIFFFAGAMVGICFAISCDPKVDSQIRGAPDLTPTPEETLRVREEIAVIEVKFKKSLTELKASTQEDLLRLPYPEPSVFIICKTAERVDCDKSATELKLNSATEDALREYWKAALKFQHFQFFKETQSSYSERKDAFGEIDQAFRRAREALESAAVSESHKLNSSEATEVTSSLMDLAANAVEVFAKSQKEAL